MELNKENMRKIRELILFTALLIVVLWKYEEVLEVLGYVGHLIFPFLLGGAIAFVLNVPMNFIERHLFTEKVRKNKVADKLARPVSLLSVLCIVVGVLTVVIFTSACIYIWKSGAEYYPVHPTCTGVGERGLSWKQRGCRTDQQCTV